MLEGLQLVAFVGSYVCRLSLSDDRREAKSSPTLPVVVGMQF
jgi:hypothetical protein